jgi:hypothetical protein
MQLQEFGQDSSCDEKSTVSYDRHLRTATKHKELLTAPDAP